MKSIIIFNNEGYVEIPAGANVRLNEKLLPDENGIINILNDEKLSLNGIEPELFVKKEFLKGLFALLFEENEAAYYIKPMHTPIVIGSSQNSNIIIDNTNARVVVDENKITVYIGEIYLNGKKLGRGEFPIFYGDCILIGNTKITVNNNRIICSGTSYKCKLNFAWNDDEAGEEFPVYKRSPRIIKHLPNKNVDIRPPEKLHKNNRSIAKTLISPLITLSATVAIGVLLGRGLMMLMGIASTATALVFSLVTLTAGRRESKEKENKRKIAYNEYLLRKRCELNSLYMEQMESLRYHNPSIKEIEEMILNHSPRIYERASSDSDFITLSLGVANQPISFRITEQKEVIGEVEDPLQKEMYDVINTYVSVPDMPVIVDLKESHLGLVGEHQNIYNVIFAIIAQLCFHQSYHDIEIITLIDSENKNIFDWIKWYPHCKVKSINISGLISAENQRDQVLGNLAQLLKERKQKKDESKKENRFLPHYIFIIDSPKMIINHSIMEHLQSQSMDLDFSLVYTTNIQSNLPDNIKTIFTVESKNQGTLLMNNGKLMNHKVKLYDTTAVNLEKMSRALTPLIHNKGVSTQIPDNITFFELYNVKKPEEIPVEVLWNENKSYKSLAVPLGVRAKDDIVYLNLHEKAHGPHGLVAGTTGSGKSEIVQSYILSLAINFHPYDVGFLLIDYKGGGMANMFEKLPHLLGTITNLDGSESMRALASIKSELARRQRIFNDYEVNNINQYTKLFKSGKASQPMPHLFLISDEFAELKKEQPEFISELVSAARIGRSLGVHLILATQKPSGVVDDQIWSNSKFKLALKVQNESDSKEVLKTPDAARITQPGRAYLQVGNNEVYELFQSAWSGAEYSEIVVEKGFDSRIYRINSLGQGELLNDDLSEDEADRSLKETQLDVIVNHIRKIYNSQNCISVEKPWLPPLREKIVSPHIKIGENVGDFKIYDLDIAIGIVDIPEHQIQKEYHHDFFKDGNFAVFGSSGFGKSTTEMNMALGLACKNSPANLNYYILDFGTASLIQLKGLPHTADYITFDENEKLDKFIKLILTEIKIRKSLFANESALNFKMYNNNAAVKIPAIIVFIDNYDVVREMGIEFEAFITKLTRDGVSVGIYTVISASRVNAVKYSVLSNFKNKIAQCMFDHADSMTVVGRSKYKLPEIKGRALVKLDDVSVMQCYLPYIFEDDEAYAKGISTVVNTIFDKNTAECPKGIPMLPETVTYNNIYQSEIIKSKKLAVGLDTENVQVQYLDLNISTHLIVGSSQSGKTNILRLACREFSDSTIFISDAWSLDLMDYADKANIVYMSSKNHLENFVTELEKTVSSREQEFLSLNGTMKMKTFCENQPPLLLLIDDGDNFVELTKSQARRVEEVLKKAAGFGLAVITTTAPGKLRGFDNISKMLKDSQSGLILGNPGEQTIFSLPVMRGYKPQIDMGFIYFRGTAKNVKIPLLENDKEEYYNGR